MKPSARTVRQKIACLFWSELSRNAGDTESAEQGFPCLLRKLSHKRTVRQFSLGPIIRERAKPVPASKLLHRKLLILGRPKAVYAVTFLPANRNKPPLTRGLRAAEKSRGADVHVTEMLRDAPTASLVKLHYGVKCGDQGWLWAALVDDIAPGLA